MTEVFEAKLLERKFRSIMQMIQSDCLKAKAAIEDVTIDYYEGCEILKYKINGKVGEISCKLKNISQQMADRVKAEIMKAAS